jgi:2-polyprenyl-3-methyl-5-hydroxy-6-metoxy-1,4-benzoquinol methylase
MPDQGTGGLLSPLLRRARIRAVLPHIQGRVLDIGCGTGELTRWCSENAYLGVDIDPESLAIARRKHGSFRFSEQLPEGETFDLIIGLAIIEHIKFPVRWLQTLKPLLSPGGRIILTTPHPSLEGIHRFGSSVGLFSREAAEEHETLLDGTLMAETAAEAGLAIHLRKGFLLGANQLFVLKTSADKSIRSLVP